MSDCMFWGNVNRVIFSQVILNVLTSLCEANDEGLFNQWLTIAVKCCLIEDCDRLQQASALVCYLDQLILWLLDHYHSKGVSALCSMMPIVNGLVLENSLLCGVR